MKTEISEEHNLDKLVFAYKTVRCQLRIQQSEH